MRKPLVITTIFVTILVLAGGIVLGINYRNSRVVLDGPSMEPTIHSGQMVSVKKYGSASEVQRGDIIEYKGSGQLVDKHTTSGKLIHRVIALPGERIVIKDGSVLVFNTQNPKGFNPDSYLASDVKTQGAVDQTLSKDTYFVMGDNRPNALDSRSTMPVPYKDIIGKVTPR